MLRSRAALLTVACSILALVVFGDLHGRERYVSVLQNAGHAPAFAIIAFVALELLRGTWADSTLKRSASVLLVVLLLGAATEGAQMLLGRDADPLDVAHDLIGALLAVALWIRRRVSPNASAFAGLVALACLGLWLEPMALCAAAYWHRSQLFPVIATFQDERDRYFTEKTPLDGNAQIVPLDDRHAHFAGEKALRISLDKLRWPGITLDEPVADWSRYSTLHVELTNPMPHAITMSVRINDIRHTFQFDDRFTGNYVCAPGSRSTFDIPLQTIARAPRTRIMNLGEISMIIVFHDGPSPADTVLVNRLWLD